MQISKTHTGTIGAEMLGFSKHVFTYTNLWLYDRKGLILEHENILDEF
jgi:hypothetical protein